MLTHFILISAVAAVAQTNSSSNGPQMVVRSGQLGGVITAGSSLEPVTGRPYSAEQVTEHLQTLADGTHIAQTGQKVMLYRDSEGRTRTERYFTPPAGAVMVSGPVFIEITDPVAGCRYMLDQNSHVARRSAWPPTMHRVGQAAASAPAQRQQTFVFNGQHLDTAASATAPARPHPEMKHESLGTQTIDGIPADGTRMTTTFPEGMMGNDRPITTVSETWVSHDLNIVLLSKHSDPRNGENTTKLSNISQSEPDPALFQVPADYSITDEQ